jgi:hypothetical protein
MFINKTKQVPLESEILIEISTIDQSIAMSVRFTIRYYLYALGKPITPGAGSILTPGL